MIVVHRLFLPALLAGCLLTAIVGSSVAAPAPDTVRPEDVLRPDELVRMIVAPVAQRPVVLQVGFQELYKSKHIRGSAYAGPGSETEGIATLKKALQPLPRAGAVVLYCGC